MFRQEVDPLADTVPPRYAYESDEEDESADLPAPSSDKHISDVNIILDEKIDAGEGKVLIIASGEVGALWARGAKLGQQAGQVSVNKKAIGFIFRPAWTASAVIISEALSRLPVWAMYPYAEAVIARWKPSSIIILDAYSAATYISSVPIPSHEAPLRYLSTSSTTSTFTSSPLEPFAPPNLLQSTSAAFASIVPLLAHSQSSSLAATLILAPSSRVPKPAPHLLQHAEDDADSSTNPTDASAHVALSGVEISEDWDPSIVRAANGVLLALCGLQGDFEWQSAPGERSEESKRFPGRRRVAADNSMYI